MEIGKAKKLLNKADGEIVAGSAELAIADTKLVTLEEKTKDLLRAFDDLSELLQEQLWPLIVSTSEKTLEPISKTTEFIEQLGSVGIGSEMPATAHLTLPLEGSHTSLQDSVISLANALEQVRENIIQPFSDSLEKAEYVRVGIRIARNTLNEAAWSDASRATQNYEGTL